MDVMAHLDAVEVDLKIEKCGGVMSNDRIAAFLNAASGEGLGVSNGSIYQFCKTLSKKAELSIEHLEEELLNQRVVATDATPMETMEKCATFETSV